MRISIAALFVASISVGPLACAAGPVSVSRGEIRISDSLSVGGAPRDIGGSLGSVRTEQGDVKWTTSPTVVFAKTGGVTSPNEGGGTASHPIPLVRGKIKIQADLKAAGGSFTGLALGRQNLAGDFWKSYDLLVCLTSGGSFQLLARGQQLAHGTASAYPGFRPDEFTTVSLEFDNLARKVTVRLNGRTVVEACDLPANQDATTAVAAGFRINERVVPGAAGVKNYSVRITVDATSGLQPTKVDDFFCAQPGQPTTLTWQAAAVAASDQVPYEVADYCGHPVARGVGTVSPQGEVRVPLAAMAQGYYEIEFRQSHERFGLVVLSPQEGPADPYFCMDAGLSWLETREALRPGLVRILHRTGIAMSRERLSWGAVNPRHDEWKWDDPPRKCATMRKTYADAQLPILEILYGGAPQLGMLRATPYPQNLVEASHSWTTLAEHFQFAWGAAEVWNEPDLIAQPADQYVTLVKTAAYALHQAKVTVPVIGGVYASIPPGSYFDACAANGLFDVVDAVSFHAYDRAPDVLGMVRRYREWFKAAGKTSMPLWLTECGLPWDMGPSRPPADQDALSALEITMKGIEGRVCGIARYFPFVFTFYEEGGIKNFGMLGREATPLRSMAAYAFAVRALSHKQYLGDLDTGSATIKLARVFADHAGENLIVLYTGKPDPAATVKLGLPVARVAGIDGRALAATPDGTVPLVDGMCYVWADAAALAPRLQTHTPAQELAALSLQSPPTRGAPCPLVLQFQFEKLPHRASARRYLIDEATAHKLPIQVRIHNLSTQAEKVVAELHLPQENRTKAHRATTTVDVPAQSTADVSWTVDASASLDVAQTRFVTVTARAEHAGDLTPLAIPLLMEGSLETHLRRYAIHDRLPIGELSRWQPVIAGHGKMKMSAPEGHWQMDVSFTHPGGAWVYPKFTLPAPWDPARAESLLIRARVVQPGRNVAIMLYGEGRENFIAMDLFPGDGAWHVVQIPLAEFHPGPGHPDMQNGRLDPRRIQRIAVGMASNVVNNTMEVSDLILLGNVRGRQ